jgi:hypothetical protein
MFFVVWGWSRRAAQRGVVGPFSCARCHWSGTFWLVTVAQRFRLYWIPLGGWRVRSHHVVCRNCGEAADVPAGAASELLVTARPVLVADPLGPESSSGSAPAPAAPGA